MKEAGIGMVRTDFDWAGVQPSPDVWSFDHLDDVVALAEQEGVEILAILDYDVPWASPAHRHLDAWLEYVRRVVGRYRARIRYWEVWNEPNLPSFWRDRPNAYHYTKLLMPTYQAIKQLAPDSVVALGGLSGIPLDFIDKLYDAGARDYFDAMNVHPYRWPHPPERPDLGADIARLRRVMGRHGDGDKPIWITEIGWPTHDSTLFDAQGRPWGDIVLAGLRALAPERTAWSVAVLDDPDYPIGAAFLEPAIRRIVGPVGHTSTVQLQHLAELDPALQHVLVLPPDEGFPADWFEEIRTYIREGGVVVLSSGVPLYYSWQKGVDGTWERRRAPDRYRRQLGIEWEAWWTRSGVPRGIRRLEPAAGLATQIEIPPSLTADRFLPLRGDPGVTPIVLGNSNGYRAATAAAYRVGDSGGGVIVSTPWLRPGVSELRQAELLTRAALRAFDAGVELFCWYELQAPEGEPHDPEHHFGILHRDLTPKPAYKALSTLAALRPQGSTALPPATVPQGTHLSGWIRPDGRKAWAVWSTKEPGRCTARTGEPTEVWLDLFGVTRSLPSTAGPANHRTLRSQVLFTGGPIPPDVGCN